MFQFPTHKKARLQLVFIAGSLLLFAVGVKAVANYVDRISLSGDLRNAIVRGDLAEVKRFEADGIDWRDLTGIDDGYSALHRATRNGQLELVRYFVENGADVMARSPEADAPVDIAARFYHLDVLKFLLIETPAGDSFADIPQSIYLIGQFVDLELIAWLSERTDLNGVMATDDVYRLIYRAVGEEDSEMVQYLLTIGAPSGMVAESWDEGFYRAPEPNAKDVAKWLTHYNTKDSLKPLHLAAQLGNEAIVKQLIDYGADPDMKDPHGKTAIDYARENGHEHVEMFLKKPTLRVQP